MIEIKDSLTKAKRLIKIGDLQKAYEILSYLLVQDPLNKYAKRTLNKIKSNSNFTIYNKQNEDDSNLNNKINGMILDYQNGLFEKLNNDLEENYKFYPNSAKINNLKGLLFKKQNRFSDAESFFEKAYQLDPNLFEALNNLGNLYFAFKYFDKAIETYSLLINLHPEYIWGYSNRSNSFFEVGKYKEAMQDIEHAINQSPTIAKLWFSKSLIQSKIKAYKATLQSLNRAIELDPNYREAYNNKCSVLEEMGDLEEAIIVADFCLKLDNLNLKSLYNKGAILARLGKPLLAEKSLKKAINISPNFELAKWNLSNCQLLLGNFQEGFLNFESRRKLDFWEKRNLIIPELENLNQVVGKKILIISEQGLGDTIQFARIGKWIADLGGIVTLEVQNPLKGLIYESKNFRVVPKNQLQAEYDYFLPLLSGIKFFINSNTDRSKVTEIVSDINYNLKWKNFFSHRKFKIGISWQGNPTHKDDQRGNKFSRSFDLQNLKFLSKLENVEIFNLQKNDGYNQIQEYGYSDFINDFGSNFDKGEYAFCDTVSIIKNLDLVITCDTSLAHLAGSLNKPVWTALKYTPDWRWLLNTSATKWYPSMKLYRQKELGNWSDVFKEIENDLNILLNSQKFVMA